MNNEFKELDKSLVELERVWGVEPKSLHNLQLHYNDYKKLMSALRIAHRLESGEVSDEMLAEGLGLKPDAARFVFRAMSQQLIKERKDAVK